MPEAYWSAETGTVNYDAWGKDYGELKTFKAEADIRAQGVPKEPTGYQLTYSKPAESSFDIKPDDPALPKLQALAHSEGWPQQTYSKVLALYDEVRSGEAKLVEDTLKTEAGKLGANGPKRVDALAAIIKSATGKEKPALMEFLLTAEMVEELEAVIRNRGVFTQSKREPEQIETKPEDRLYPTMRKRA